MKRVNQHVNKNEEEEENDRKIAEARSLIKMKNTPILVTVMKKTFFFIVALFIIYEILEFRYTQVQVNSIKTKFDSSVLILKRNMAILDVKFFTRKLELRAK